MSTLAHGAYAEGRKEGYDAGVRDALVVSLAAARECLSYAAEGNVLYVLRRECAARGWELRELDGPTETKGGEG